MDNFEVAFALYPRNARLAILKDKYKEFFKMFGDSSPISKALCVWTAECNVTTRLGEADDEQFIPKFSLDLSQVTPKNLRTDIDESSFSALKEDCIGSIFSDKGKNVMQHGSDNNEAQLYVGDQQNTRAAVLRPRRGIKASHVCKSPYVSRVIDVNAHQITTEERNVWDWLFNTRDNIK